MRWSDDVLCCLPHWYSIPRKMKGAPRGEVMMSFVVYCPWYSIPTFLSGGNFCIVWSLTGFQWSISLNMVRCSRWKRRVDFRVLHVLGNQYYLNAPERIAWIFSVEWWIEQSSCAWSSNLKFSRLINHQTFNQLIFTITMHHNCFDYFDSPLLCLCIILNPFYYNPAQSFKQCIIRHNLP